MTFLSAIPLRTKKWPTRSWPTWSSTISAAGTRRATSGPAMSGLPREKVSSILAIDYQIAGGAVSGAGAVGSTGAMTGNVYGSAPVGTGNGSPLRSPSRKPLQLMTTSSFSTIRLSNMLFAGRPASGTATLQRKTRRTSRPLICPETTRTSMAGSAASREFPPSSGWKHSISQTTAFRISVSSRAWFTCATQVLRKTGSTTSRPLRT